VAPESATARRRLESGEIEDWESLVRRECRAGEMEGGESEHANEEEERRENEAEGQSNPPKEGAEEVERTET